LHLKINVVEEKRILRNTKIVHMLENTLEKVGMMKALG
jgi:hypothetical protein